MTDTDAAVELPVVSRSSARSVVFAHLLALTAATLWGANFSAIHIARDQIGAVPLFLFRYDLCAVILLVAALFKPPNWRAVTKRGWVLILALAIAIGPAYQLLLLVGAEKTGAGLMGILIGTQTLHVTWLSPLLLKEKLRLRSLIAVLIAFTGVAFPIFVGKDLTYQNVLYPLLVAMAALLGASNVILPRYMRAKLTAWDLLVLVNVAAAVVTLPMITPGVVRQWTAMNSLGWTSCIYLATLGLPVATYCFYLALRHLTALTAACYMLALMAIAAVWAWLLLGETFDWRNGVALTCVGIALILNATRSPQPAIPA